jgi:hypothetical protein
MDDSGKSPSSKPGYSRRDFIKRSAAALPALGVAGVETQSPATPKKKPNMIVFIADLYATQTGVWTLTDSGVGRKPDAITLATVWAAQFHAA